MGRVLKSNNSSNSGDGGGGNGNDGISGSSSTSSSAPKIPNTDVHEAYEMNASTWQTRMHRVAIKLAGTYIGQAMMMQFDKLLWTLEKTAAWICSGKTGKSWLSKEKKKTKKKKTEMIKKIQREEKNHYFH